MCSATASRTKVKSDSTQDIILDSGIKPGGLKLENVRWTMRIPGVKDPVLLGTEEQISLSIAQMPHKDGKLIEGTWTAVMTAEYVTADGRRCKLSCPVVIETSGKGWNKKWLFLLGALGGLLTAIPRGGSQGQKNGHPGCTVDSRTGLCQ